MLGTVFIKRKCTYSRARNRSHSYSSEFTTNGVRTLSSLSVIKICFQQSITSCVKVNFLSAIGSIFFIFMMTWRMRTSILKKKLIYLILLWHQMKNYLEMLSYGHHISLTKRNQNNLVSDKSDRYVKIHTNNTSYIFRENGHSTFIFSF